MSRGNDNSYGKYRQYRASVYQYKVDQIVVPFFMFIIFYVFKRIRWLIILGALIFFTYAFWKKDKVRKEKVKKEKRQQLFDIFQLVLKEKRNAEDTKDDSPKEGELIMKKHVDKQRVYEYLSSIPKGKVVTYGQIAEYLGDKNLARTVGNILHSNPDGEKYPCYKVVNAKGMLSEQYAFGGIDSQRKKLQADGVDVDNNKVDLNIFRW